MNALAGMCVVAVGAVPSGSVQSASLRVAFSLNCLRAFAACGIQRRVMHPCLMTILILLHVKFSQPPALSHREHGSCKDPSVAPKALYVGPNHTRLCHL